ncbi:hypothetical protein, partial [Nocardia cerradoensis]|uniref:hypothetical protein n=1 Tax=Nocardia cerradoensis TaxID=85688 RepID=UPI001CB8A288
MDVRGVVDPKTTDPFDVDTASDSMSVWSGTVVFVCPALTGVCACAVSGAGVAPISGQGHEADWCQ